MATVPSQPLPVEPEKSQQKPRMWHRFSISRWIGRDEQSPCPDQKSDPTSPCAPSAPGFGRRLSRKVVPGLPRPATFRRQNSERREKLSPVQPSAGERRAVSVDRKRALSARPASPPPIAIPKLSAPELLEHGIGHSSIERRDPCPNASLPITEEQSHTDPPLPPPPPPPNPQISTDEPTPSEASLKDNEMDEEIKEELEKKWILNLSMHFRDHSPREKFFLTYAETPHRWRRVTISCDYRDAPPDSLERDLQSLQFQRDKSARIYEAIRMSLQDIQFYDTVTNLKLETRDDRLHVHVTEDNNEIIPYPSTSAVRHLDCRHYKESELTFDAHMSGFVYKVNVDGHVWIKKEIPGPDSVDEFLYEINALTDLVGSKSVIQFQGLVVSEDGQLVKGLLIAFAEEGALVDILYDNKGQLSWLRREQWAKQIVQGLSEIHEAGFVQGDFTLSNIVIDEHDEAKIIDINRRGCPVGWEPPEISKLVESSQRISMYIGVKSDLFQLGMVLWALAEEEDEPERQPRPLSLKRTRNHIPQYFRDLVELCLSDRPRQRLAAKDMLPLFPQYSHEKLRPLSIAPDVFPERSRNRDHVPNMEDYEYDRDGVRDLRYRSRDRSLSGRPGSIDIPFDGPGSYIVSRRGRQPAMNTSHLSFSDRSRGVSADHSDYGEPNIVPVSPTGEHRWEEIEMDGNPYLIQRDSIDLAEFKRTCSRGVSGGPGREFHHIDSGLADMDLVGVGGQEALTMDPESEDRGNSTPRGIADEMRLEDHDRHGDTAYENMNLAL